MKKLSLIRLYNEFPFLLRVVFLFLIISILYYLITIEIELSLYSFLIAYLVFIALGLRICGISRPEETLLKGLDIPIYMIHLIKCLLLSVFFFLPDIYLGLFVFIAGTSSILILLKRKKQLSYILKTPYILSSYQWISMFRPGGTGIYLSGFFLFSMGLWHENTNLTLFSIGWLVLIPCLLSFYMNNDPKDMLVVYKTSSVLLRMKLKELIVNSLVPVICCLPFICFFSYSELLLYTTCIILFLYANIIMFYSHYIFYPSLLLAIICCFCILPALLSFYMVYPILSLFVFTGLIPVMHILAKQHLKTVLNE